MNLQGMFLLSKETCAPEVRTASGAECESRFDGVRSALSRVRSCDSNSCKEGAEPAFVRDAKALESMDSAPLAVRRRIALLLRRESFAMKKPGAPDASSVLFGRADLDVDFLERRG